MKILKLKLQAPHLMVSSRSWNNPWKYLHMVIDIYLYNKHIYIKFEKSKIYLTGVLGLMGYIYVICSLFQVLLKYCQPSHNRNGFQEYTYVPFSDSLKGARNNVALDQHLTWVYMDSREDTKFQIYKVRNQSMEDLNLTACIQKMFPQI